MKTATSIHLWILGLLFATLAGSTGCQQSSAPSAGAQKEGSSADEEAQQYLNSVVGLLSRRVDPGTYATAVQLLNKFVDRRPGDIGDLSAEQRKVISSILGPADVTIAESKRFSPADIEALRQAFFFRGIALRLTDPSRAPIDQAQEFFRWTCQQVSLVPTGWEPAVPPIDSLRRGLGDYQERMWVFLELLRQSDLVGAVVGVTTKDAPESITAWLACCIVDGKGYLFDPVSGLPVLLESKERATLEDLAADPSIVDRPYGDDPPGIVDPKAIDKYSLLISFDATQFAPRMAFLQNALTGKDRVNLVMDYDATIRAAADALAKVPSNLGVQPWHFPSGIAHAFASRRTADPVPFEIWKDAQLTYRTMDLEGQTPEAVRFFVAQDLRDKYPIVVDIVLRPMDAPLVDRRRAVARQMESPVYFAGLAQQSLYPDDPSIAVEWLNRYVEQGNRWQIDSDQIIDIVRFCRLLAGHEGFDRTPWHERVFSLLPEPVQELVRKGAAHEKESTIAMPPTAEGQPTVDIPEPLSAKEVTELWNAINAILARPDFEQQEAFAQIPPELAHRALPQLLAKDPSTLTPEEVAWRNRLAFDVAFADSVVPVDHPWLTGAIASLADNLRKQGNIDRARELLLMKQPLLAPIQVASLRARANALPEAK